MKSVLIVVDNLNVGGIERIALDQLYCFTELGVDCVVVSLSPPNATRSLMTDVDGEFFLRHSRKVLYTASNWHKQIHFLFQLFRRNNFNIALCHSPRANLIIRCIRILTRTRLTIVGFIHQVPTFSNKMQNLKRGIYFRFSDYVWASSNQFKLEIDRLRQESTFFKILFRGDITFDRPGIFLKRIDEIRDSTKQVRSESHSLVFYGRAVSWKGFETFLMISSQMLGRYSSVVITSKEYEPGIATPGWQKIEKPTVYVSKSIASIKWTNRAVHLYPTNYGELNKRPMSVSLNVLECIALGIPSLISQEGFESWPELQDSILCKVTTWDLIETKQMILELESFSKGVFAAEAKKLRGVISIEAQCKRIVGLF